MFAVFSRGIRRIPHLESFLGGKTVFRPKSPEGIQAVVGWGFKPTARRARSFAAAHGLPYVALEDGFLRSQGLGVQGAAPLSVVFDDLGIYYDATRTSRLEQILLSGDEALAQSLADGRRALALVLEHGLSKYNTAPDRTLDLEPGRERVLVVDQTAGDLAVTLGMADESSFRRMLAAAREENPDALVLIKTHPDVNAGKRKGYLGGEAADSRTVLLRDDISPAALLGQVDRVYTVSSLLGFEAVLRQKRVTCFGVPFYAGWGVTDDRVECPRRNRDRGVLEIFTAAYLLYSRYVRPESGQRGSIFDVIEYLARQRRFARENGGRLWCFGFQRWKRHYVRPFLSGPGNSLVFVNTTREALSRGLAPGNPLLAWGHNEQAEVRDWAVKNGTPLARVEDGFIRSVGLGSDLIGPMSLVVDRAGIYYDATRPSDLETLLNSYAFSADLLERASRLREIILQCAITKYNTDIDAPLRLDGVGSRDVVLVPGQVEGDASIRFGCRDVKTNIRLLEAAREQNPGAYLVYKPHPDTVALNRRGYIPARVLRRLCDHVETRAGVLACLEAADEVHTMTSLSGFDALLRGKQVVCHGVPFYAGWGLTRDLAAEPRRARRLSLDQLVAGVLILYPRYYDPFCEGFVEVETIIHRIVSIREELRRRGPSRMERALQPGFARRQARKLAMLAIGWAKA